MSEASTLSPAQLGVVRTQVLGLLDKSPHYQHLQPDKRDELAQGLVKLVGYLADPAGGQRALSDDVQSGALDAGTPAVIEALAKKDAAQKTGDRLSKKSQLIGQEFKAGAMDEGVDGFEDLVDTVDFPEFVTGLIDGVFDSIVDASIRQMEAYGELVKGVVQSVDDFATENISQQQAREFMVSKHPGQLQLSMGDDGPMLAVGEDVEDEAIDKLGEQYGLTSGVDLSEKSSEAELVRRAQLEMAKSRQKMLATMVMMGVNRIVVTDGLINAKVIFDIKTSDAARRKATASLYDRKHHNEYEYSGSKSGKGWWGGTSTRKGSGSGKSHHTTVGSAVETNSESKAEMKAKLTGEVRVKFKSETVDLNLLASQQEAESIKSRANR